jgi:hypothetical protein
MDVSSKLNLSITAGKKENTYGKKKNSATSLAKGLKQQLSVVSNFTPLSPALYGLSL